MNKLTTSKKDFVENIAQELLDYGYIDEYAWEGTCKTIYDHLFNTDACKIEVL